MVGGTWNRGLAAIKGLEEAHLEYRESLHLCESIYKIQGNEPAWRKAVAMRRFEQCIGSLYETARKL